MQRRRIASGSPFEPVIGFSRAIVAGEHVSVSGTAPVMADGGDPPADAGEQLRRCFEIALAALAEADATPADVVRTRTYLTRAEDWEAVGRVHGEVFAEIRPASTMVVVKELLDPRWLVEIELDAIVSRSPA